MAQFQMATGKVQAEFQFRVPCTWGGRRDGAGRPRASGRRNTPHRARAVHKAAHPIHVTLRARHAVGSLRRPRVFSCVKQAIAAAHKRFFRTLQFSVQDDHVHLLVEADDQRRLSSGMRGLSIRIARSVNKLLGRKGDFWADRYHARALKTPREVRNVLVYVLMNHRKHGHGVALDPRSSAAWFDGFRGAITRPPPDSPIRAPQTWLASVGWKRHGLIDISESPTSHP
jgi:putative transposase